MRRVRSNERFPVRLPILRTIIYRGKLAVEMLTATLERRRMATPFRIDERPLVDAQLAAASSAYDWSPIVIPEVRAILVKRLNFAKSRAGSRGRAFSLKIHHLEALYAGQAGRCAVTGLPFDIGPGGDDDRWRRPFPPSLDRIDSSGGYTPENVRLVCAAVNNALGPWGEAVFAVIAQAYITGARSSAGERSVHTGKVAGSIPAAPTTSRHRDRVREVYFVQGGAEGLIKIGVTNNVHRRIIAMQTLSPVKLKVLGVQLCANHGSLEGALHIRFAHLRQHGEWFLPAPELLAHIAEATMPVDRVPDARRELERDIPMIDDIKRKQRNRLARAMGRPDLIERAPKRKVRA